MTGLPQVSQALSNTKSTSNVHTRHLEFEIILILHEWAWNSIANISLYVSKFLKEWALRFFDLTAEVLVLIFFFVLAIDKFL